MEHSRIIKASRIGAVIAAVGAILSMQTDVTPLKVILMTVGIAWLALGVYADGRT